MFWARGRALPTKKEIPRNPILKALSETDQTEEPKKVDVPTWIIHEDDDGLGFSLARRLRLKGNF